MTAALQWRALGTLAIFLGTAGCLTATPPKTPNQREAERTAPRVVVPPPPDAGRTPRRSDPG